MILGPPPPTGASCLLPLHLGNAVPHMQAPWYTFLREACDLLPTTNREGDYNTRKLVRRHGV